MFHPVFFQFRPEVEMGKIAKKKTKCHRLGHNFFITIRLWWNSEPALIGFQNRCSNPSQLWVLYNVYCLFFTLCIISMGLPDPFRFFCFMVGGRGVRRCNLPEVKSPHHKNSIISIRLVQKWGSISEPILHVNWSLSFWPYTNARIPWEIDRIFREIARILEGAAAPPYARPHLVLLWS